jgi:hypothetical protein
MNQQDTPYDLVADAVVQQALGDVLPALVDAVAAQRA